MEFFGLAMTTPPLPPFWTFFPKFTTKIYHFETNKICNEFFGSELFQYLARQTSLRMEPTKTASYNFYQEQRFPWLLGLLQQLYAQGFRIISHEVKTLNRTFVLIS